MPAQLQVLSLVTVHAEMADKTEPLNKELHHFIYFLFSANSEFACMVLIYISSFCKQDSLSSDIKTGNYG